MTQEDVAEKLGISRQAVAKWESGQSLPSTDNLIKAAELFNVSMDELTDAASEGLSPLEEYAVKKLEEEAAGQQRKAEIRSFAKKILVITFTYAVWAAVCLILFRLLGVESYIWNWMKEYYVLPLTWGFSIFNVLLGRNASLYSLGAGTAAATIAGNIAGKISVENSEISYNNGWVYYLAVLFIAFVCGLVAERKNSKSKTMNIIFYSAAVIAVAICAVLAVRHVKFGAGGEAGYREGYEAGTAAAANDLPYDNDFSENFPEQYEFGSAEFSGYARYWPDGYDAGYGE